MKKWLLLALIILLAAFLRFYKIDSVPPSLYWDEVSQAYNAYSLLETGRDEHGEFLPLARFIAFGDYKAPVNIYLTVPSLALFGQTEFAVRFPSAFFGTLTVLTTYILVSFLFFKYKRKHEAALLAAFFLAVSPWHIQLSRASYEGNIATFFTVLAITLFFAALRSRHWLLVLSGVSFVLGFYAFNAHRVFIPLLVLVMAALFWKQLWSMRKIVISTTALCLILLVPFLQFFLTPESKLRFQEVNIFTEAETVQTANQLMEDDGNTLLAKVLHNRRVLFAREYMINYFDFFNPTYLFFTGDENPRFSTQFTGQLFLWLLPLLLIGAYVLYRFRSREALFVVSWFLLAPVAAATARETPHALRSETFIPTFEIIAALGATHLLFQILKAKRQYVVPVLVLFGGVILFSLYSFWHNYSVHHRQLYSYDWQYGYKQMLEKVTGIADRYDTIYITSAYGRPYIYTAWYADFTPREFWEQVVRERDQFGFYNVHALGKYHFTQPDAAKDTGKTLYVTQEGQTPEGAEILDRVSFLDGTTAFVLAEK